MSAKETTLLSLGNQEWRTVKFETEKVNDFLRNIPTNDITNLNDLICAGKFGKQKKKSLLTKILFKFYK